MTHGDQAAELLLNAFAERRPVVLFLGQDAWSTTSRPDPMFLAALERISQQGQSEKGWLAWLAAGSRTVADYEWLTERFRRNVQTEAMDDMFDLPWSALFTTSIDPMVVKRLETRGRQPESVLAGGLYARALRSRNRPPVNYLFGRSDQDSQTTRAPRNKLELLQRFAQHANPLLMRMVESATSLGLIVVDGYVPERDWLALDQFFGLTGAADSVTILWFGASPSFPPEAYSSLIERGSLVLEERRLAGVVAALDGQDVLEPVRTSVLEGPGVITLEPPTLDKPETVLAVSPSLRLRVEASAAIVDDTWTEPAAQLGGEAAAEAFRRFHGDLGGPRALIDGIARGFAIKRDFETELRKKVDAAIGVNGDVSRVILLHGQSGTGKTIALCRLGYDLRREAPVAVLFARGRVPPPIDIDDFCAAAEQAGATATVLLCDANQSFERYADLSNSLRSRGRRVLIVGTSYRSRQRKRAQRDFVESRMTMEPREVTDLKALAGRFGVPTERIEMPPGHEAHALALFYRTLSVSRPAIISGISSEARSTERKIQDWVRQPRGNAIRTQLADQLLKAGLHGTKISFWDKDENAEPQHGDAASRLIDYVMSAGRLNCPVPLGVLVRVVSARAGSLETDEISGLFRELDIFRWHQTDAEGNEVLVGPRLQLEAELICRIRLADRQRELEHLTDLIRGILPGGTERRGEVQFVWDLLQKLGAHGPREDAYAHGYLEIGRSLTALRLEHQVQDARLMLQESVFRRAAIRLAGKPRHGTGVLSEEQRAGILDEAREVVEIALQEISQGRLHAGNQTTVNLHTERAAIYGYLAVGLARRGAHLDNIWANYLAARAAIRQAMNISDNSYFPFDIGLWTPRDLLAIRMPLEMRAELEADLYAVLDQVDPTQLPLPQAEQFRRQQIGISRAVGNQELSREAYQALADMKSTAGYFLRAREICPEPFMLRDESKPVSYEIRHKATSAAQFLRKREGFIRNDFRCLYLLFQYEWLSQTGFRPLQGVRHPLPHRASARNALLSLVREMNEIASGGNRYVFAYLESVLAWLTGDQSHAAKKWDSLSTETDFEVRGRTIRRHYVADERGNPKTYRGQVESQRTEGHWRIVVEGIPGRVDLLKQDFRNEDLQVGREVRDFTIAFNFIGPVADPMFRYGRPS